MSVLRAFNKSCTVVSACTYSYKVAQKYATTELQMRRIEDCQRD